MYSQSTHAMRRRRGAVQARGTGGKREQSGGRERVRLIQLVVCLALFLTVFIGKGVFPQRLNQVGDRILGLISANTDFRAAFADLGESLARQDSVLGDIGEFCVEVFGTRQDPVEVQVPALSGSVQEEGRFLSSAPDMAALAAHYLRLDQVPQSWLPSQADAQPEQTAQQSEASEPVPAVIPAAGTVVVQVGYSGPQLPEHYTMDQLSLGALETATPVFGPLRSTYGYRDHPIDGAYKFHNGVDIGADQGETIGAFAAGTVEYVGESDAYGLYLQLDHGNGVKSFYAHCSRLCVSKGQTVAVGEKVAEVGSTGNATGPHLHMELKWNGTHLNPAYYIDYKENV